MPRRERSAAKKGSACATFGAFGKQSRHNDNAATISPKRSRATGLAHRSGPHDDGMAPAVSSAEE
jgi:hypothetical protein